MARETGAHIPALASRVDPDAHVIPTWVGYWRLTTERSVGTGTSPIPWRAVAAYADELELTGDSRDEFFDAIAAMDAEFLDWATSRMKAEVGNGNSH